MQKLTPLALGLIIVFGAACGVDAAASPPSTSTAHDATSVPSGLPPSHPVVDVAGEVTLGAGDVVRIGWADVDLALVEVNDSRCPATPDNGIVCVWEGNVLTTFEFQPAGGGPVERRVLEGYVEGDEVMYGDTPATTYGSIEITVTGVTDDDHVVLQVDRVT